MVTLSKREEYQVLMTRWEDANPLRQWRQAIKITVAQAASIFGVSIPAVQKWESGVGGLRRENMERLIKVLRAPDLDEKWTEWLENKPMFDGPSAVDNAEAI